MSVLSKRLLYLRELKDLSQAAVAKVLNMSPTGYYGYESGRTTPPPETLIKLAEFYSVSVDYLLGYEPEDKELSKLILEVKSLTPDRRQQAIDYVRLLKLDMTYVEGQRRRAERKQAKLKNPTPGSIK